MSPPRLLRNLLSSLGSWLVPLAIAFAATPIVIRRLGLEAYGVFVLAAGYASAVGSLNLGRGMMRELASNRSADPDARARLVGAALAISTVVGLAGAAILALGAGPLAGTFAEQVTHASGTRALLLAAVVAPLMLIWQTTLAVPQGMHRFDVAAALAAASGAIVALGNVGLAVAGYGVLHLLFWNIAVMLASVAAGVWVGTRVTGAGIGWPTGAAVRALMRFNTMAIATQVASSGWILVERSLLAGMRGPDDVALFSVPMTIGIYLHSAISSTGLLLVPMASQFRSAGNDASIETIYRRATKAIALVVTASTVTVAVASYPLLALWIGEGFAQQAAPVLTLLAVAYGLNCMATPAWFMNEGLNHPERNAIIAVTWAALGSALAYELVPRFGLIGAGWARLAALMTAPVFIVLFERRLVSRPDRLWPWLALRLVPLGALLGVWVAVGLHVLPMSWISLLAICGSGTTVFAALAWISGYFDPIERQWLLDRLEFALSRFGR